MMYSFSHLAKGPTCFKVYSLYVHCPDAPTYVVRAALVKGNRVHLVPEHASFKNIDLAEAYHRALVLHFTDKGYTTCSSTTCK